MLSSYWNIAGALPRYPQLDRDAEVDVVVIGGGLTGLTAAYLIKRAGRRVALLERGRLASIDTASTTAHLSCVVDLPMSSLIKSFGADHARAVWDAGLAAITQIAEIVDEANLDTRFAWVRGYLHAPVGAPEHEQWHWLDREAQATADLGFDVRFVERAPLLNRPAVEIDHQARFHPAPYLRRLAAAIDGDGSAVYEDTPVQAVEGDPIVVVAGLHRVKADYVVIATHTPMAGKSAFLSATLLQSKLALYTSYAVAGRVASGRLPDALFWDTGDPYRYLRIDRGEDYDQVIYGGEDHKTGQATDGGLRLAALESALVRFAPDITLTHRWAGQVVETNDGLPYIGETSPRQFVATGFSGNGMTFGTLAAMMARDHVIGATNPWTELFDVGRTKIVGGLWDYLKENKDYPYYLIRNRFAGPGRSLRALPRSSGKILELDGTRVAAYRHADGDVTLLSPACTHLGCQVEWNNTDHTWDCPCHGSRFSPTGDVLSGPAESALGPAAPVSAEKAT
jgi:glycine/D-amino acid oxidase-like deaminating enzyme/nitrite reductase/ring-hydroxylating ferredoxin subunit